MLACRTAHIDYGITHATERSVDAYIGEFGYFLEREFLEITHKDYLALDGRERINEAPYVSHHLCVDVTSLNVALKHIVTTHI